jgi:glycosyltransferase involved in cell wall biosynthesis
VIEHGRTGFLCQDEADMAAHTAKLDDLDRGACRAAVEGYFSTERMIDEHIELYEELLT